MSDDDDWFERALGESESDGGTEANAEATEDAGADTDSDAEVDGSDDAEAGADETVPPESDGATPDEDAFEALGADLGGGEVDPTGPEPGPGPGPGPSPGDDDEGEGSPFDEDFASAFQNAPDPEGGPGDGGGGPPGGFGGEGAEGFDADEEFESSIERIELGIEGLDEMILGGVPERSLISVIGSAGTGKTTFGLQFLNRALADGKRGVYITLEESTDRIYDTAEEKGWSFAEYAEEGRLAVVHLDPIEMANSLTSIRSDLPELVEAFDADRLVLDSVSLLEMMYDHPSDRRSEVYQFTRALKQAGVTTLVTSEADSDNAYGSRYGIIEYLADAVFVLQYVRPSDFQETRLALEIQKIRDANHSRETKPYEITNEGLSVYRQANIF
jgi:KaiC domain protein